MNPPDNLSTQPDDDEPFLYHEDLDCGGLWKADDPFRDVFRDLDSTAPDGTRSARLRSCRSRGRNASRISRLSSTQAKRAGASSVTRDGVTVTFGQADPRHRSRAGGFRGASWQSVTSRSASRCQQGRRLLVRVARRASVRGDYGSPDFWASYDAAVRERHMPEPGKFRALVTLYKASADYQKLAVSTKTIGDLARSHRRLFRPAVDRRFRQSQGPQDHPPVAQQIRRDAAHRRHGHAGFVAGLRLRGRAGHAHGQSVRGNQGAVFRRSRRHHLDRCRYRRIKAAGPPNSATPSILPL